MHRKARHSYEVVPQKSRCLQGRVERRTVGSEGTVVDGGSEESLGAGETMSGDGSGWFDGVTGASGHHTPKISTRKSCPYL